MLSTGMMWTLGFFAGLLKWCNLALYGFLVGVFLCFVLMTETAKGQVVVFKLTDRPLNKDLV